MQVIKPTKITNDIGSFIDGAFTRTTTGTFVGIDGLVKTAAINIPRLTYDPTTLVYQGLLIEPAATNLALFSDQFDNASWTKLNTTVTANAGTDPIGTTIADKLLETTANAAHSVSNTATSYTTGLIYTLSVYVKAAERSEIKLGLPNTVFGGVTTTANFNLTAGVASGATNCSAAIVQYPNGWYRCSITATATASTTGVITMSIGVAGSYSYTGIATSGLLIWGAQLEQSSRATSYIPTTTVAVLRGADVVTGSNLLYTDLTDATAIWSSATTYAAAATVRYLGYIYISLVGTNLNKPPDTSPTFWVKQKPDNLHSALDTSVSTASSTLTELTLIVKSGKLDSIALINVVGAIIEVSATNYTTGEIFYNATFGLSGSNVQDWYQYFFFDPITQRTQIIASGINSTYPESIVTVRVRGSVGATVSLGSLLFGLTTSLGQTQLGAQVGIVDYSRKETDDFGTITFVERPFSKRMSVDLFFDNSQLNVVQRFLYSIRATPVVWVASDDPTFEEALVVYGFYKDFSTTISYSNTSLCSLEIEGLT